MTLRTDGLCFLHFVLLPRSIARLTGCFGDQPLCNFPTAGAVGAFAIGAGRRHSPVDDALCLKHPG